MTCSSDLDDDQRRAVTTESQLVAVVAGAGSGKTRVLTRRVAYRVATGTADEAHTLVLTFTREAAGELRRRLPRLGLSGRVTAGTFHSIAHGMLQQRWRDLDQRPQIGRSRSTADRQPGSLPATSMSTLLVDEIGWATARALTPAAYESTVRRGERRPSLDPHKVAEMLDAYRRDKHAHGVVDLDDLLALTIEAIENDPAYADAQRWRFRHLLVDEAQDLNPLQHRLLDHLRAGRDDVYLVGDAAQAIYGFNGSDPALLIEVERRFPGCRGGATSGQPPLHAADRRRRHARARHRRSAGRVAIGASRRPRRHAARPRRREAEAWSVARSITRIDRALIRSNQVAVLARTNAQLPRIERELAAAGVAVRHAVFGAGSPIQPFLNHVYRLSDGAQLRSWAQDALEGSDPGAAGIVDGLTPEQQVGRAVLDFLRSDPVGDGIGFRAWIDATDPFGASSPGVELLTFHGAKGREWHTVHLVGCETSLVPHRSATTNAARAEETRLLYVAITRATDDLVINWARRRGGYQRRLTPLLDEFTSRTPQPVPPPPAITARRRQPRDVLLEQLAIWRADTARVGAILPEAVCSDTVLAAIADHRPASPEALDELTGMGMITSKRLYPGIASAIESADAGVSPVSS